MWHNKGSVGTVGQIQKWLQLKVLFYVETHIVEFWAQLRGGAYVQWSGGDIQTFQDSGHHPQEELPYQYLRLEFPTRRLASHCLSLAIAPSSAPRPSLWPTSVQYLRHNYVHVFFQWYAMQCQQYSNMPRSSIPSPTGSLSSGIQARLFVIWDIIHPMHHCIHFTIWVCLYILVLNT